MKKHLYEIKRLDIPAYLKWWFIKYRNAGTLSEVLENLTSPITLTNSLKRRFKIFKIGGNSVQDGDPSPATPVEIQNVTGNVEVKVKNRNQLISLYEKGYTSTKNGVTATIQENGEVKLEGTATNNTRFELYKINLEENNSYYANIFNSLYGSSNIYLQMNGSDYTFYKNFFNSTSPYNSIVNDANAIVYVYIPNGVTINTVIKPMIQIGSEATDYEPHEQQTAIFPLEEGQRLHEGDTIEDKIVQRRGTYQFTGRESFAKSASNTTNESFCCYTQSISPKVKSNGTEGLLNIGIVCKDSNLSNYKTAFGYSTATAHFLKIEKTAIPNWDESLTDTEKIALFKAFLAQQYANGTPVTLEYELETPREIPFTENQAKAKKEIDKLISYKGTTHISSSNDPSPLFTIQYVKEET